MTTLTKGYGKYARAIALDPKFSPMEKAIFSVLCCSVNYKTNYAWITISEIAACTPCSTATVNRTLKKFEKLNLIERQGYHVSYGKSTKITRILV